MANQFISKCTKVKSDFSQIFLTQVAFGTIKENFKTFFFEKRSIFVKTSVLPKVLI